MPRIRSSGRNRALLVMQIDIKMLLMHWLHCSMSSRRFTDNLQPSLHGESVPDRMLTVHGLGSRCVDLGQQVAEHPLTHQ